MNKSEHSLLWMVSKRDEDKSQGLRSPSAAIVLLSQGEFNEVPNSTGTSGSLSCPLHRVVAKQARFTPYQFPEHVFERNQ